MALLRTSSRASSVFNGPQATASAAWPSSSSSSAAAARAAGRGRGTIAGTQQQRLMRAFGLRVLLLAVVAAVAGTAYLQHLHLRAFVVPRRGSGSGSSVAPPQQEQHLQQQHQKQHYHASSSSASAAAHADAARHHHATDPAPTAAAARTTTQQPAAHQTAAAAAAAAAKQPGASAVVAGGADDPLPRNRLLLATHSRLMWYFPDTHQHHVLHEGEGVHYGAFPGEAGRRTVWTAVRPHNWRPTAEREHLVELDAVTGAERRRVVLPSRFTHDVVRRGDAVYVCDTGNGRVLELAFPSMAPRRAMELFTLRDHPNTLAPLGDDNFLVVLHNLGSSDVVRVNASAVPPIADPAAWLAAQGPVDPNAGVVDAPATTERLQQQQQQQRQASKAAAEAAVLGRVQRVGDKAHGLVPWQGAYIMLDSDNGALVALDLTGASAGAGFRVLRLWKAPETGVFLKGLAVVDDVAYFGVSPWAPRSARDDPRSNNELAAFDLVAGRLLWRRQVPTGGLLNTVAAPHLSEGSTYQASYTGLAVESDVVARHHSSPEVAAAVASQEAIGYPPRVGGYWASGLPYLDASLKATKRPWEAGLQLPLLMLNVSALQAAVAALEPEMWTHAWQARHSAVMAGREGNQNAFKPGVEGIVLLFSANDGSGPVFKFPMYDRFAAALEPLLEALVGRRDTQHIIRLQLALMKPGVSDIKIHVDSGGYAVRGHRIHIPVFTHPEVSFDVCPHRYVPDPSHVPSSPDEPRRMLDIQECFKIPTVEGFAFELNNRAAHRVSNLSPVPRVHVVFDLVDEPKPRVAVPPGTECDYDMEQGLLCKYPQGMAPAVLPPARWVDAAAAAAEVDAGRVKRAVEDSGSGYFARDDEAAAAGVVAAAPAAGRGVAVGSAAGGAGAGVAAAADDDDDAVALPPVPSDDLVAGAGGGGIVGGINTELLVHPEVVPVMTGNGGRVSAAAAGGLFPRGGGSTAAAAAAIAAAARSAAAGAAAGGGIGGVVSNGATSTWVQAAMQGPRGVASA